MTRILLCTLLTLLIVSAVPGPTKAPELEALKKEVIKDILSATIDEGELLKTLAAMKADGSWPDIDYSDKTRGSWPVNDHLVRLNNLAVMYTRKSGDESLKKKILLGLDYWFKNDFICPNWWYPQIGVPKVLGPTMILMEKDLSPEQKAAGVKILNRAQIGMTGQNKVWLSGNVIYKSLLTDSVDAVKAAVAAIQSEIVVSQGEGIQVDNSFHQHGAQQQFGNYGSAFAADMLKWGNIFQPTDFRFNENKIEILRNYLLKGMKWVVWGDQMDISACGRQLFPGTQMGKAKAIKTIFNNMAKVDPRSSADYELATSKFSGDTYFWRSEMSVHRTQDFYTSVRMLSSRVGAVESCNEENMLGYHLGDGANYFYQSGNEYTDIFPFWNWKRIPGTTAFQDPSPLPALNCSGYRMNSNFVGGLPEGLATMAYNRDSLLAQKSWFFFDDVTVCLGAGINSILNKEVSTTVNQSFLHGKVQVNQGGKTSVIDKGTHNINDASWIIHDNWAYVFPQKTSLELSNREQSGDWHSFLKRMPAKEEKAEIFTLGINHHQKPKDAEYAYYVLPKANPDSIQVKTKSISIISNNAELQAVEDLATKTVKIVFVKPGTVNTKSFGKISAGQPCVVIVFGSGGFSYADPTQLQMDGTLTFQGSQEFGTYDKEKNLTTVKMLFPQGALKGAGVRTVVGYGKVKKNLITGD